MAKAKQEKSEGPFLVVDSNTVTGNKLEMLHDGASIGFTIYFKTRPALEKFLKDREMSGRNYYVFEGLAKITFTHTLVSEPINVQ